MTGSIAPANIDNSLSVQAPPASTTPPPPLPDKQRERRKLAAAAAQKAKNGNYGATINSIEIDGQRYDLQGDAPKTTTPAEPAEPAH